MCIRDSYKGVRRQPYVQLYFRQTNGYGPAVPSSRGRLSWLAEALRYLIKYRYIGNAYFLLTTPRFSLESTYPGPSELGTMTILNSRNEISTFLPPTGIPDPPLSGRGGRGTADAIERGSTDSTVNCDRSHVRTHH